MENAGVGSRAEFLARVQRFTDMVLERLGEASEARDVDEKEARMWGSLVLKVLRLWDKALLTRQVDSQLEDDGGPGQEEGCGGQQRRGVGCDGF